MPEQGDRRYDATPYRRQKAREEGQIPRSQDLSSAAVLVGAIGILLFMGEGISGKIVNFMEGQLETSAATSIDESFALNQWLRVIQLLVQTALPLMALTLLVALASNLFQTGLVFLPNKLGFQWSRVNPQAGIKRLFSLSNVVRLGFGLIKVLVVVSVALTAIYSDRARLLALGGMEVSQFLPGICQSVLWISMKIAIALFILALFDFMFQRWKHEQDLKMTEQEMRDELKTTQGDPQIAARRRAVQRQLAMNRVGSAVPQADAVVTNPTELAIAIRYDMDTMAAPIVVAKGAGVVAQQIRRLALENGIPIVERKELARILYKEVEIDHEVPPAQYAAVAEVLRYVYELQGKELPSLNSTRDAA